MTCVLLNEKGEIIVIVIVLVINVELNLYFRFTLIGSFEMIKFLKLQMILDFASFATYVKLVLYELVHNLPDYFEAKYQSKVI